MFRGEEEVLSPGRGLIGMHRDFKANMCAICLVVVERAKRYFTDQFISSQDLFLSVAPAKKLKFNFH